MNRNTWKKCVSNVIALIVAAFVAVPMKASPIIQVLPGPGGLSGVSYGTGAVAFASFTLGGPYSNVGISAGLSGFPGTAYLTTAFGPGTTVAHEVARQDFGATSSGSYSSVLSIPQLAAGTYFLTIASSFIKWDGYDTPMIFTSSGNAVGGNATAFIGAATYSPGATPNTQSPNVFLFEVTGELTSSPVPEPSSASLLGVAVTLLWGVTKLVAGSTDGKESAGAVSRSKAT